MSVLSFFDENLEMSWYQNIDEYIDSEGLTIYKDTIYLLSNMKFQEKYRFSKYDLSGKMIKNIEVPFLNTRYVSGYSNGITMQQETNITGILPQPPYISLILYSTELVYSGYDFNGKLLWREAFESTF